MDIRIFPYNNNYFNAAITALCDIGFDYRETRDELIIVCIAPWSIKDVISAYWLQKWTKSKILIVSDSRFFPLAKYLQLQNKDTIEVCHTLEFYSVLGDYLWCGELNSLESEIGTPHLTEKEYFCLRYVMEGISAEKQAISLGVSPKTVFGQRAALAKKLNVKKLAHLISPHILRCHQSSRNNLQPEGFSDERSAPAGRARWHIPHRRAETDRT